MHKTNPPHNRSDEFITIVTFVMILLVLGIIGIFVANQNRAALEPTPVTTPTAESPQTATPTVGAVANSDNPQATLTSQSNEATARTNMPSVTPTVLTIQPTNKGAETATVIIPTPTETGFEVNLPVVPRNQATLTPTPTTEQIEPTLASPSPTHGNTFYFPTAGGNNTSTPTFVPTIVVEPTLTPSHTATLIPTIILTITQPVSPTAILSPTATIETTATATEVITPTNTPELPTMTPTFTPVPTFTSTPRLTVSNLKAVVRVEGKVLREGPSNLYPKTKTLSKDTSESLLGRDETGEWVYFCCPEGAIGWIRQAYAPPSGNSRPTVAPTDANPDSVDWLRLQPVSTNPELILSPTPIPETDYPLYRYNRGSQSRIPQLPQPPLALAWSEGTQGAQQLISPIAVVGSNLIVARDDNHIYSIDRFDGKQRWRLDVDGRAQVAPAVQDNIIYVALTDGRIKALADQGAIVEERWEKSFSMNPTNGINIAGDTLFITGVRHSDSQHALFFIDRINGDLFNEYPISGTNLHYPTVGHQLVYLGNQNLVALDIHTGREDRDIEDEDENNDDEDVPKLGIEEVWIRNDINNISAPVVYDWPEPGTQAVLYVADSTNKVYSLNANTGGEIWNFDSGELVTALAIGENAVYASGNGFVKAIDSIDGKELWRAGIAGEPYGAPIAAPGRVVVATNNNQILFFDAENGENIDNSTIFADSISGPIAINQEWIYVTGADNQIRAFKGAQN